MNVMLSEHFSLAEFTRSSTAVARGIDNTPAPCEIERLKFTAEGFERVMRVLGFKPSFNSVFRSAALNEAVGGAMHSQHIKGEAGDATCGPFGSPWKCALHLAERQDVVQFDQLILEYGLWFHCSFTPNPRGEVLTARREGGKTVYYPGIRA